MGRRLRDGPIADHLEQQLDSLARDLFVGLVNRGERFASGSSGLGL